MKANEAPEKLYLSKNIYGTYQYQVPDPDDETAVEYIKADAFIKKACDAYCKVCGHYPHTVPTHICRQDCDYYREFQKAMIL